MFLLNNEYNWFWDLETDVMKDYKYYFAKSNPQYLKNIQPEKKKKKTFKTF